VRVGGGAVTAWDALKAKCTLCWPSSQHRLVRPHAEHALERGTRCLFALVVPRSVSVAVIVIVTIVFFRKIGSTTQVSEDDLPGVRLSGLSNTNPGTIPLRDATTTLGAPVASAFPLSAQAAPAPVPIEVGLTPHAGAAAPASGAFDVL